jgi:hypothetical protein
MNFLLDDELQDDQDLKEKLKSTKSKIKWLTEDVEKLELLIQEKANMKERMSKYIGAYKLSANFDETKALVHSIIGRIEIKHRSLDKGGLFQIRVHYRGFQESVVFETNWTAKRWLPKGIYKVPDDFTPEEIEEEKYQFEKMLDHLRRERKEYELEDFDEWAQKARLEFKGFQQLDEEYQIELEMLEEQSIIIEEGKRDHHHKFDKNLRNLFKSFDLWKNGELDHGYRKGDPVLNPIVLKDEELIYFD